MSRRTPPAPPSSQPPSTNGLNNQFNPNAGAGYRKKKTAASPSTSFQNAATTAGFQTSANAPGFTASSSAHHDTHEFNLKPSWFRGDGRPQRDHVKQVNRELDKIVVTALSKQWENISVSRGKNNIKGDPHAARLLDERIRTFQYAVHSPNTKDSKPILKQLDHLAAQAGLPDRAAAIALLERMTVKDGLAPQHQRAAPPATGAPVAPQQQQTAPASGAPVAPQQRPAAPTGAPVPTP